MKRSCHGGVPVRLSHNAHAAPHTCSRPQLVVFKQSFASFSLRVDTGSTCGRLLIALAQHADNAHLPYPSHWREQSIRRAGSIWATVYPLLRVRARFDD